MDFFDQAKAMWSALDEMSVKNPEAYKKFIHDQLHGEETQDMLRKLKLGGGSGPSQKQRQGVPKGPGAGAPSKSSSSKSKQGAGDGDGENVLEGGEKVPQMLSSIVGRLEEEDQGEVGFKELKLPGNGSKTKKKLIEEL